MEAILELQNALIKDYYKDFIVSLDEKEIDFNDYYFNPIVYRENEYFEKNLDVIHNEIRYITDDIKPLYVKALGEILVKLSNLTNPKEKLNYLVYTTKLLTIPLNQLKKDYYINEKKSRYFSKPAEIEDIPSIGNLVDIITNEKTEEGNVITHIEFSSYALYELSLFNIRLKTLSFLPFSLFTIASSLINILQHKINEVTEELEGLQNIKSKLKWVGKPSQLGYIIGQLAQLDYIEPPKRDNGEINYSQFGRDVLKIFNVKTTQGTLSTYLNIDNNKAQETHRNFEKANFNIPHKKEVS